MGDDEIENWEKYIDVMVSSISDNGGRSCVNASAVIVPKYAKEIADALGKRLGPLKPLPVNDPNAVLSGFANPKMGEWIDQTLKPTLLKKEQRMPPHPTEMVPVLYKQKEALTCVLQLHIVNRWIMFCPIANFCVLMQVLSKSHKLTCYGQLDPPLWLQLLRGMKDLKISLLAASNVERLNIGAISTMKISWDQPHEGNMFEFLYKRRSIGMAA